MPSDIGTSHGRQYQVRDLVTQLANLNQTVEQRVAKRTAEAVEQAQKLRLPSTKLSLAEEAERRRIAEMLHEDLQQLLVAARMQLAALCITRCAAQREPIAREIADVLKRSFELIRSLSVELAPSVLHERGLAAALEWLAAETRKNYNVEVTIESDSSANPKAADGGPGFDPTLLDAQRGSQTFGLLNICERVSSFGGEFQIDSGPKRGSQITLSLLRGPAA